MTIGRNIVQWPMLEVAPTCLTVPDICLTAHAVAHFEGRAPPRKKWHKFDAVGFFDLDGLTVPVVCDRKPATQAFWVGFDGQSARLDPDGGTRCMSRLIGDSTVASLICATEQFVESECACGLDDLSCTHCSSISPVLLSHEMMEAGVAREDVPKIKELSLPPSPLHQTQCIGNSCLGRC